MASRKSSVYLEEKIKIEENKIKILEARKTDPAQQKPYVPRDTTYVAVRSMSDPNDSFYLVSVSEESLTKIAGDTDSASLGLIGLWLPTATPTGAAVRTNKYRTFDYPKLLLIHGTGSPTRVITEWGTKWLKNYAKDGKQSHRLIPFGAPDTNPTPTFSDVVDNFEALFSSDEGSAGALSNVLGTNGSISLVVGKKSIVRTITA